MRFSERLFKSSTDVPESFLWIAESKAVALRKSMKCQVGICFMQEPAIFSTCPENRFRRFRTRWPDGFQHRFLNECEVFNVFNNRFLPQGGRSALKGLISVRPDGNTPFARRFGSFAFARRPHGGLITRREVFNRRASLLKTRIYWVWAELETPYLAVRAGWSLGSTRVVVRSGGVCGSGRWKGRARFSL